MCKRKPGPRCETVVKNRQLAAVKEYDEYVKGLSPDSLLLNPVVKRLYRKKLIAEGAWNATKTGLSSLNSSFANSGELTAEQSAHLRTISDYIDWQDAMLNKLDNLPPVEAQAYAAATALENLRKAEFHTTVADEARSKMLALVQRKQDTLMVRYQDLALEHEREMVYCELRSTGLAGYKPATNPQ
jgi:hypothetical protein